MAEDIRHAIGTTLDARLSRTKHSLAAFSGNRTTELTNQPLQASALEAESDAVDASEVSSTRKHQF